MRVFDETKSFEIFNYDLNSGYLENDNLFVMHHGAVPPIAEVSHNVLVAEYPNGGKEYKKVIDIPFSPAKEAYDEYESILVYKPFSSDQLKEKRIIDVKKRLSQLSEDFIQSFVGAYFTDLDARKKEFAELHNELRLLLGKTPRTYF